MGPSHVLEDLPKVARPSRPGALEDRAAPAALDERKIRVEDAEPKGQIGVGDRVDGAHSATSPDHDELSLPRRASAQTRSRRLSSAVRSRGRRTATSPSYYKPFAVQSH